MSFFMLLSPIITPATLAAIWGFSQNVFIIIFVFVIVIVIVFFVGQVMPPHRSYNMGQGSQVSR